MGRHMLALVAGLSLGAPSAADVIVVANLGGAGIDFFNLGLALSTAQAGDIVLVRPGSYSVISLPFTVQAKGVAIVADAGGPVILHSSLSVANVPLGSATCLSGLRFEALADPLVAISSSPGTVLLTDCRLRAEGYPYHSGGLRASQCSSVVVQRAWIAGSHGLESTIHFPGSPAIDVADTRVSLYSSAVLGGKGSMGSIYKGSLPGGAGVRLVQSTLHASRATVQGGAGGDGSCSSFAPCGGPAAGGPGISWSGAAAKTVIESVVVGGVGGSPCSLTPCGGGAEGATEAPGSLATFALGGNACELAIPRVLREGQASLATLTGTPGDRVLVAVGTQPCSVFAPQLNGVVHLVDPQLIGSFGIPPSGSVDVPLAIGELGSGVEGAVVWIQIASITPLGEIALGPLDALVLLDAQF